MARRRVGWDRRIVKLPPKPKVKKQGGDSPPVFSCVSRTYDMSKTHLKVSNRRFYIKVVLMYYFDIWCLKSILKRILAPASTDMSKGGLDKDISIL